jgi:hypothetical protein
MQYGIGELPGGKEVNLVEKQGAGIQSSLSWFIFKNLQIERE